MASLTIENDTIALPVYGSNGRPEWADVDWTLYRRSAIVDDRKINYVDLGDPSAKPVLLIHGLAGCWQNWLENVLPLSYTHRVLAIDLPGFGQSDMPQAPISIAGYARAVQIFLGQLGITRIALIGNSMGGQIGLQAAIDYPELVESVIAVSPAGISTGRLPAGAGVAGRLIAAFDPFVLRNRKHLARRPGLRRLALQAVAAHPEKLRPEIAFELFNGVGKPGFVDALRATTEYDFRDQLGAIKCPVLIVWGTNDYLITHRDAKRFQDLIPGARRIEVRDTGHVTMLERPDWFNQIAPDFIAGSAAAA